MNASDQLYEAVTANDQSTVLRLLAAGTPDINYRGGRNGDGTPLLAEAISCGHFFIASLLIAARADVNRGNDGSIDPKFVVKTPLNLAIRIFIAPAPAGRVPANPADALLAPTFLQTLLLCGARGYDRECTVDYYRASRVENTAAAEAFLADYQH